MTEIASPSLIAAVSAQLPDVTEEHVGMVLTVYEAVISGPALGTVLLDPPTGNIAMRVAVGGIHQWRITSPDGGTWADMAPTLPDWIVIKDGDDE